MCKDYGRGFILNRVKSGNKLQNAWRRHVNIGGGKRLIEENGKNLKV